MVTLGTFIYLFGHAVSSKRQRCHGVLLWRNFFRSKLNRRFTQVIDRHTRWKKFGRFYENLPISLRILSSSEVSCWSVFLLNFVLKLRQFWFHNLPELLVHRTCVHLELFFLKNNFVKFVIFVTFWRLEQCFKYHTVITSTCR